MTPERADSLRIVLPSWLTARVAATAAVADEEARMSLVIELARCNVETGSGGPFAAAVFDMASGELLAAATNIVVASRCSAAHAELLALALAQQALGRYDLGAGDAACELVSSAEPCLMCAGAVLWSGVRRLVFAANDADVREVGFDEGPKHPDWIGELRRRGIEVVAGRQRAAAKAVLADYRTRGGVIYNGRGAAS